MPDTFDLILEDFHEELAALQHLVTTFQGAAVPLRSRIAAANSATLLLAATFEEFIRQVALEFAKKKISSCASLEQLPPGFVLTAWRRTLDSMSRLKLDTKNLTQDFQFIAARTRFNDLYDFCRGDFSKDIYDNIIHNENNMRPNELNSLFKLGGLQDICLRVAQKQELMDHFGEVEGGKTHGKLLPALNEFFERRNTIAHALNSGQSSGQAQILQDISLLTIFSRVIATCLQENI